MIESLNKISEIDSIEIVNFCTDKFDYDFYYTKDNNRIYITDADSLRDFMRESRNIFYVRSNGDFSGMILLWKSSGGGKERYYVKITASNKDLAEDLLTVLLWNTEKDLYVKIRNDSPFLSLFRAKGFRFEGNRGCQILLKRKKIKSNKDGHNERNNSERRDLSEVSNRR